MKCEGWRVKKIQFIGLTPDPSPWECRGGHDSEFVCKGGVLLYKKSSDYKKDIAINVFICIHPIINILVYLA